MTQSCRQCTGPFEITQGDLEFYDTISPTFSGIKFSVPPPTLCPECRFQMRLMMRNDRHLYHRKSSLSGRQIISIYAPEKTFPVYDQTEWWSDAWDARTYGREIDESKPLCEQLQELRLVVPRISLFTVDCDNSYFTNHALHMKNCYLVFGGANNEDCMFGNYVSFSKDTLDGLCLYTCERCYEGISSQHCYDCVHFTNCRNCTSCMFIEDCESCSNCIGCFGLHRKENCMFNEQLTKEEFLKRRKELGNFTAGTLALLQKKFTVLKRDLPHRSSHTYGSEECTGAAIYNSKNCTSCFDVTDCEDGKFLAFTPKGIHTHDATFTSPGGLEWCYNIASTVGTTNAITTFLAWYGSNVYYSIECHSCRDIFACAGLRNARYCILNKQYTKEEYEREVARLITHMLKTGEWGEFFPKKMCPYGYNETNAIDYLPLTRAEALSRGFQWRDELEKKEVYLGPKCAVSDDIAKIDESICDAILVCEVTGKPFKIIPQELKFYRTMGLPLPRRCFEQRHKDRLARRNPRKLWERQCDKCKKSIQTNYSPNRSETVYCENCYLADVY